VSGDSSDHVTSSPLRRAVAKQHGIGATEVYILRGSATDADEPTMILGTGAASAALDRQVKTGQKSLSDLQIAMVRIHL